MGRNLGPLNIKDSYEGLVQISGSQLTDGSGSLIPSLDVSASFATTATSASHALNADNAISSSYALTASFAENVVSTPTGSFMVTGSVTDATLTFTKGDASTFPLTVNNVANAVSASHAVIADSALAAATATSASHAVSSDTSISASHAVNADSAISSSYATTASFAENVSTPNLQEVTDVGAITTNAITSSGAFLDGDVAISGDLDVNGTITYISSSTLQIGDNVIEINYNKAAGNSGILTYDTTSPFTASLLWDAIADRWIAGPFGSEETIILSSDTGSMSVASASVADTATSASHAVNADSAISSSYAVTASYAENAGGAGGKFNDGAGLESIVGQMASSGSNSSPQGFLFGSGSSITTTGKSATILGSYNSSIGGGGVGDAIIGGNTNIVSGNNSVVLGGSSNETDNTNNGIIIGGGSNYIDGGNDSGLFILGASSTLIEINGGQSAGVIGGINNDIRNFSSAGSDEASGFSREVHGGIVFGKDNYIGKSGNVNGRNGLPLILGGYSNDIGATTTNGGTFTAYSTIINSSGSSIDSGSFQGIIGGYENYVSGSDNAYIIASNNSTIDSHNNSVIIGGNGLSTSKNDEVVVPSLVATELTASGLTYPTADGSNGDVLTTDGAGNLTLQPATGGAAFP